MWGILGAGFGAVFKVVAIIFGGALIWSGMDRDEADLVAWAYRIGGTRIEYGE